MRSVQIFIEPIAMVMQWEMYGECHIKTTEEQSGQNLLNVLESFKNHELERGP